MRKGWLFLVALIGLLVFAMAGCTIALPRAGGGGGGAQGEPAPTHTAPPTHTPQPTHGPLAIPTDTPAPQPTYTSQPTYTPQPTYTSQPTYTPGPTHTPVPTQKPVATKPPTQPPAPTSPPDPCAGIPADVDGSITPKCGNVNTRFTMDIWGFAAGEHIGFWLNDINGPLAGTRQTYDIGPSGSASDLWFYPHEFDLGSGLYSWVFEGTQTHHQSILYFKVIE